MSNKSARLRALAVVLALAALPGDGPADVVYLRDGYALHGKVRRTRDVVVDEVSGESISIPEANGFFYVDDGPRFTIFSDSPKQVKEVDGDVNIRADMLVFHQKLRRENNKALPKIGTLKDPPEFNDQWKRELVMRDDVNSPPLEYRIRQQVTILTPYFVRIDSTNYAWTTYFMTREVGPERVRKLLASHPDLAEKDGKPEWKKRSEIFKFMIQAGWFDAAEKELARALKDLPQEKNAIDDARKALESAVSEAALEEVERFQQAGRHVGAQQLAERISPAILGPKPLVRLNAVKAKYSTLTAQLELARRYLDELTDCVSEPEALIEAARAVREELSLDAVDRLDTFVTLAQQAERLRGQNKLPPQTDDELLALAVSGWLLGKESAEAKVETAVRLWTARKLVLEYLGTDGVRDRDELAARYVSGKPIAIDELTQLISLLPPADPEPDVTDQPVERRTRKVAGFQNGVPYLLQLPPEYQHNRPYPVLFVLHHSTERPKDILDRFSNIAARNGYILAAPQWNGGLRTTYDYTAVEHNAVTQTLRDLRRHFNVDSDRVFLFGFGEGANMAFDVGTSHPDLFAGVATMSGIPRWSYMQEYWRNAQNLPFYVVGGEQGGEAVKKASNLVFKEWMPRGYPALQVLYKGRGLDWYDGELPVIFDWMSRKRRANAVPDLGLGGTGSLGQQYRSMRSGDNRFYWLSSDAIDPKFLKENRAGNISVSAHFHGMIREGNQINVVTQGLKQVTVWLGRGMIDFDKPVQVRVNRTLWNNRNKPVEPKVEALLEDLHQRGDRLRPYLVKLEFDIP